MMKNLMKTLILYGMVLLVNNVHAYWQGNIVLGVSGSYVDRRGQIDIDTTYTGLPDFLLLVTQPPVRVNTTQRYSDVGMGWGLLAGYQIKNNGWIWGIEGSVDWLNISTRRGFVYPDALFTNFTLVSWSVKSEYKCQAPVVAFSGRMAYEVTPYFIPYLRLGLETSDESLDVTIVAGSAAFPNGATLYASRKIWHYLAGVGFEVPLGCSAATFRAEYNYHSRAKTIGAFGRIEDGVINPVFTAEMSPITNTGKVGIVWNFS